MAAWHEFIQQRDLGPEAQQEFLDFLREIEHDVQDFTVEQLQELWHDWGFDPDDQEDLDNDD